jgi:TonB family protein
MNCTAIAAILDDHREARLAAAERHAVDTHLVDCADCAGAWHAQGALLALTVPAPAPALLDRVLAAVDAGARPPRRPRRAVLIGVALVGGAALAAVAVTRLPVRLLARPAAPSAAPQTTPAAASPAGAAASAIAPATRGTASRPIDATVIALSIVPIVRAAPDYPAEALQRGLEGSVTLRFDVAATGRLENVGIVDSTDPVFENAALAALAKWKYLPRLAEGKRVPSRNVQTVIRFALAKPGAPEHPSAPAAPPSPSDSYLKADFRTFNAAMEAAMDRTATDDFRGAELTLDELRARYALNGSQEGNVWDFYAYLYVVQGYYDRAIDAYESGLVAYARAGVPSLGSWLPLANLYFARHQYDMALRTLLTYKERVRGTPAGQHPNPAADEFIARLRALGVTEATLPPGR